MRTLPLVLGLLVTAGLGVPPARAIEYPWCAEYGHDNGGTNCGFVSREQCQATISGVGGICVQNPQYQPTAAVTPGAHSHTRYRTHS
jgi:Protein of unknown function (DUF3551)